MLMQGSRLLSLLFSGLPKLPMLFSAQKGALPQRPAARLQRRQLERARGSAVEIDRGAFGGLQWSW